MKMIRIRIMMRTIFENQYISFVALLAMAGTIISIYFRYWFVCPIFFILWCVSSRIFLHEHEQTERREKFESQEQEMNDKQTGSLVMMLFQEDEAKGIIPDPDIKPTNKVWGDEFFFGDKKE